jgi:hypothetical protein
MAFADTGDCRIGFFPTSLADTASLDREKASFVYSVNDPPRAPETMQPSLMFPDRL